MEVDSSDKYLATGDINGLVIVWNICDYSTSVSESIELITTKRKNIFFSVRLGITRRLACLNEFPICLNKIFIDYITSGTFNLTGDIVSVDGRCIVMAISYLYFLKMINFFNEWDITWLGYPVVACLFMHKIYNKSTTLRQIL